MTQPNSHLFLSYNRSDLEAVVEVQRLLNQREIRTFLDRDKLVPGLPWPHALEEALRSACAVAVFLGPEGLGVWQKREMYFALDRQAQAEKQGLPFHVIPVLLPNSDLQAGFLFLNTWIDLRQGANERSIDSLVEATKGTRELIEGREFPDICPYRGLRAFREEDAAFYFGRASFAKDLADKITTLDSFQDQPSLVAVVGPSGSGKSSVVQAGLLPLLRRQRPPHVTWDAVILTPGADPWRHLASALLPLLEPSLSEAKMLEETQILARALSQDSAALLSAINRALDKSGGTDRLLVVVDQFEELFTLTQDETRGAFINALVSATRTSRMTVAITLRGDFYGRAVDTNRTLSDALAGNQVNLGPMTRQELKEAIEGPARRVGLTLERGLADRIMEDVLEQPGNLPLLEYALTELWNRRNGKQLTIDAYEHSGRVAGSIAARAEALINSLNHDQQRVSRRVFMRLVRVAKPGEDGSDTRLRIERASLGKEEWTIVNLFAAAQTRLLITSNNPHTGGETVEVAHESLIRHWKRLRDWIDDDRTFLLWRQELAIYLAAYFASDKRDLLRGEVLQKARHWLSIKGDELNAIETEFIRASVRAIRSRLKWVAASVGVLLLVLAVFTGRNLFVRRNSYQANAVRSESHLQVDKSLEFSRIAYSWMRVMAMTGDKEAALIEANRIDDPIKRSMALYNIAVALGKMGQRSEADVIAQEALKSNRKIDSLYDRYDVLGMAKELDQAGVKDTARDMAEESLTAFSTNTSMDFGAVAEILVRDGQEDKIFDALTRVGDPANQASYYNSLALIIAEVGSPVRGKAAVVKALDATKRIADPVEQLRYRFEVAKALAKLGNVDEAIDLTHETSKLLTSLRHELSRLIDVPPTATPGSRFMAVESQRSKLDTIDPTQVYAVIAQAVAIKGKIGDAFELIEENTHPNDWPGCFASVADALAKTDETAARKAGAKALDALTGVIPRVLMPTKVSEKRKSYEQEKSELEEALFTEAVFQTLCRIGMIDEALRETKKLAAENPNISQSYSLDTIARKLAENGSLDRALEVADEVDSATKADEPNSATKKEIVLYCDLALWFFSAGRVEESKSIAQRALASARAEKNNALMYGLAVVAPVLARVGKLEEARKAAEEALQLAEKQDDVKKRSQDVARIARAFARIGYYYEAVKAADSYCSPWNRLGVYTAVLINFNNGRNAQLTKLLDIEEKQLESDALDEN